MGAKGEEIWGYVKCPSFHPGKSRSRLWFLLVFSDAKQHGVASFHCAYWQLNRRAFTCFKTRNRNAHFVSCMALLLVVYTFVSESSLHLLDMKPCYFRLWILWLMCRTRVDQATFASANSCRLSSNV